MRKRKAKKTVAIIVSGMEFSIWLHVYLYSCKLYNMQCLAVEDKCPKLQCCIWDIHVICTHIVIINWYFQSRRIGILNQHIRYSPQFPRQFCTHHCLFSNKSWNEGYEQAYECIMALYYRQQI